MTNGRLFGKPGLLALLLIVPAGHNVIRLLPALTANLKELAESVRILDEVFAELNS